MKLIYKNPVIIIGLIVVLGGLWYMSNRNSGAPSPSLNEVASSTTETESVASSTTQSPTGAKKVTPTPPKTAETYTNGIYKFSLSFPKEYQVEQFANFHELNNVDWRVKATTAKRGVPVISVPVLRIDQGSIATGKKYPLFFTAEVRVGVSPDIAQCYATDDGYTNQKITNVTINGVNFKRFDFADAGMMKYVRGSSYRTIHANKCYVIEQVRNGTSYWDDTMLPGYTEAQLDAIYNKTTPIVYSFKFI